MIRWLDCVVPGPATRPPAPDNKEVMQRVTHETAFEPGSWTPDRAARVAALFDEMAPVWNERQADPGRNDPMRDALARGALEPGTCLEVGSGTGLFTPILAAHFSTVAALDLSHEMLKLARGCRVQADAAALPFADATFDSAVLVNALLFPSEIARVLRPAATLAWVSTRGVDTPIYLAPDDVAAALPGEWTGVAADAGIGSWAVVRRA